MPEPKSRRKSVSRPKRDLLRALSDHGQDGRQSEVAPDEWRFIDPSRPLCLVAEKRYLLEYELAREAEALGLDYRSSATWGQIFGSDFPRVPFLAIDPVMRARVLKEAFTSSAGSVPMLDHTEYQTVSYTFEYALKSAWQDLFESAVEERRQALDMENRDRELHQFVSDFRSNLPPEAYDKSVAHVALTLRFDYSDDRLKAEFAQILGAIRQADYIAANKDELDANLKRLAATRLYRIFGTVEKARSYVYAKGFENPYQDDAGWTRARQKVRQLLGIRNLG